MNGNEQNYDFIVPMSFDICQCMFFYHVCYAIDKSQNGCSNRISKTLNALD